MTNGSIDDTATTLPDNTWTVPSPSSQVPMASGTRDGCANYLLGDQWQWNVSGMDFLSNCQFVAEVQGVTVEDFQLWNPSEFTQFHRRESTKP